MAALESSGGKNTTRIALLAVFVLLAVAVAIVWLRKPAEPDVDAGRVAADAFLALLQKGQAAQAWDTTTADFKSFQGRETFVKNIKQHPELLKPVSFVSVQTVRLQESPRAEYLYRTADGHALRLLAGNEQTAWRVDRLKFE